MLALRAGVWTVIWKQSGVMTLELEVTAAKLTGDSARDIKSLSNHVFMLEEKLRYTLRNLDVTNFNDLGLARYENGRLQIYTEAVEIQTEKLRVEFGKETDDIHALISATTDELLTEIESVEGNYAGLKSQIVQTANKISAVVSAVDDSNGNVTAASIVAAINSAGSTVKINADHIVLSGVVTVSDLNTDGAVEINAGNIKAGGTIEGVALKGVTLETVTQDPSLGNIRIENAAITFGGAFIERFIDGWGRVNFRVLSQDNIMLGGLSSLYLVPPGGGYWSVTNAGFYKYNDYGQLEGYIAMTPT